MKPISYSLPIFLMLSGCSESMIKEKTSSILGSQADSSERITVAASSGEKKLMLGTRWMVSSTLSDIFGPTTSVATGVTVANVTQEFILGQPTSWGGPCDPYADSFPIPTKNSRGGIDKVVEKPSQRGCSDPKFSHASILPIGSTSRLAWNIRTCDRITAADAAVRKAATWAGLPESSSINQAPSETLIRGAYDLFYNGQELPADVLASLTAVTATAAAQYPDSPEAWRFLFLTLCMSPGWQIL